MTPWATVVSGGCTVKKWNGSINLHECYFTVAIVMLTAFNTTLFSCVTQPDFAWDLVGTCESIHRRTTNITVSLASPEVVKRVCVCACVTQAMIYAICVCAESKVLKKLFGELAMQHTPKKNLTRTRQSSILHLYNYNYITQSDCSYSSVVNYGN